MQQLAQKQTTKNAQHYTSVITSDYYQGERLDTHLEIDVDVWIGGNTVDEFFNKLDNLLNEYHI